MENGFNWINISNEIAKSILKYKNNDEQLMDIIQKTKENMNKNIEKKSGEKIREIDGFSAMNIMFMRPKNVQNRNQFITDILKEIGKQIEIPSGEYKGIPSLHRTKVRITNGMKEEESFKKALWNLFDICLQYSDNPSNENEMKFIENYNIVINEERKLGGNLGKHLTKALTVSMFLCCPNTYLPLDINTLKEINRIRKIENYEEFFKDGKNYINLIKEVKNYIKENNNDYKTIYELSAYSYQKYGEEDYTMYSAGSENVENRDRFYKNHYYTIHWKEIGDLRKYIGKEKELKEKAKEIYKKKVIDFNEAVPNFMNLKKGDILILKTQQLIPSQGIRGGAIHAIGIVTESFKKGYRFLKGIGHAIPVEWVEIFDEPIKENDVYLDKTLKKLEDDYKERIIEIIGKDVLEKVLETDLDSIKPNIELLPTEENKINEYNKNIILYGPPGTGKTYNSVIYAVAICNNKTIQEIEELAKSKAKESNKNYYEIIKEEYNKLKDNGRIAFTTFHQSYSYEDFIEGIKPTINDSNEITYEIKDGIFKKFCKDIGNITDEKPYVFIIDEINRGNISKIFGELITLVEENKRAGEIEEITAVLPYSGPITGEEFSIPNNVYIIGTMNTADRSIALMDTALRRRFKFIEMLPEPTKLPNNIKIDEEEINLEAMLDKMNKRIEVLYDREHTIGHAFFMKLTKMNNPKLEDLKNIFTQEIIPLLQEYFYDDYSKIKLVLGNDFIIKNEELNKSIFNPKVLNDTDMELDDILENQYKINEKAFDDINNYKEIYK